MYQLIDKIVGLVAPHTCLSCGVEGTTLCRSCIDNYQEPVQPRCAGCRALMEDFRTCEKCLSWLPVSSVFVTNHYESIGELLVKSLKFDHRRQSIEPMADSMYDLVKNFEFPEGTVICAIPNAPSRVRQRGFDHTALLAERLSKKLGMKQGTLLGRHTNTRQVGSSRKARFEHMSQAFDLRKTHQQNKYVLLVDDVVTTGATISAATKLLKRSGVKRVYAVVFAQKN